MLHAPPHEQKTGFTCGPGVLKIVLGYYGVKKSEREFRRLAGTTEEGTSAEGLVKAAKECGFEGEIRDNATIRDLRRYIRKKIPVIVEWFCGTDGHYSVVVDINDRQVKLQDPLIGDIRTMTRAAFKRVWFGFESAYPVKETLVLRRTILITRPSP